MKKGSGRYSLFARAIHWLTALMVLTMVPAGLIMVRIGRGHPVHDQLFGFHSSVGIVLMALTLARLAHRLHKPPAALPCDMPVWQRVAARATHMSLYGFLIVNPFIGWIMISAFGGTISVFGLLTLPAIVARDRALGAQLASAHEVFGLVFAAIIVLHIAAALHHGLVRKDGVLNRML